MGFSSLSANPECTQFWFTHRTEKIEKEKETVKWEERKGEREEGRKRERERGERGIDSISQVIPIISASWCLVS